MPNLYSNDIIQEICDSNDIVDVVSQYVTLKRTGSNYKGLCPFHSEKTPSFVVSQSKQIFNCFGCGEGGDVISFIMKHENLNFTEALQVLADKAGIVLEVNDNFNAKEQEEKDKLYEINKEAARYFFDNLKKHRKAQEYITKREIDHSTTNVFGLGYSTPNWQDILNLLKTKGFKESDIEKTGLIIKKKDNTGYYDRFRDRLMFPIISTRGKVIGFGGRVFDDSQPKYLNSPETQVFSKGNNLYALNTAKKYSRDKGIILVEGYMDVISLYKQGIRNCVASLGTALTSMQARLLKKYSNEIYICYDSDEAGVKATNKALDILRSEGIDPRIIMLKESKDPDEFINKNGKEAFKLLIDNSLNYIDYKLILARKKYDISNIEDKISFTREIASVLRKIESPIKFDAYVKKISYETNISIEAIKNEVHESKGRSGTRTKDKYINANYRNNNKDKILPVTYNLEPGYLTAEKNLLKLIINDKKIHTKVKDYFRADDFLNKGYREIGNFVYEKYNHQDAITYEELLKEFGESDDFKHLINDISINFELEDKEKEKAVDDFINKIKHYKLKIEKENIKNQLGMIDRKKDKTEGDEEKYRLLCIELVKIEKEMRKHQ